MTTCQRIAVLGAGPMGLAVAYQLSCDGHSPVLFEADDRVGGMTASFDFGGLPIERYYHFHCTSDRAVFELLEELGLSDKLRWVETKMGYWLQGQLQPWGNPKALLRFRGLGMLAKLRYGIHAFAATRRNDWRPLDGMDAKTWIRRWVGGEAYDVLWKSLLERKFHGFAENLSAAWIWSRIRRIGRSRQSIFREKLGYLEGGSKTLMEAMMDAIVERGGEIRLKSRVDRIVIRDGAITGIKVNGEMQLFDKVISTIPIPYVPDLLPDLPQPLLERYRSLKNIAVVCVIAKLRRQLTENFWLNINDPEMDIPGLVEYTNLRPMVCHIVYAPFYMPGEHPDYAEPDAFFLAKIRSYIKRVNPDLTDLDFIDMRAHRYRFAQPVCLPNHLSMLPDMALPVKGLWVADTSYYYPEDRGISESVHFGRNLARLATGC